MNELKEIYSIKYDSSQIKKIQQASLDNQSFAGYKIENSLLFGTKEWFSAIEKGEIESFIIKGIIKSVRLAGHNDFPEFEIRSQEGVSSWTRKGDGNAYKVGHVVELTYVLQKYKRPSDLTGSTSKHIIKIDIGN